MKIDNDTGQGRCNAERRTGQGSRSEDRGGGPPARPRDGERDKSMQNVKAIIDLFGGLAGFR